MMQAMGEGMAQGADLLFGRRTYEDFFAVWPGRKDNPFTAVLDNSRKYVASRTLREPLPWQNSTLLAGDAAESVARLKEQPGKDLVVLGSGDLLQTLMRHGLVDEYVLLIHPLVLGRGRRLFNDDAHALGAPPRQERDHDHRSDDRDLPSCTMTASEPTEGRR